MDGPQPLSRHELVNLWVDEPVAPFQIALLGIFDAGPFRTADGGVDTGRIRGELARRAAGRPAFRRRIGTAGRRPSWVEAPTDEPASHITCAALPLGTDVLDWAATRIVRRLDPVRPLWRIDVAALADGRFAVLVVVHHAVADGLRGIAMAAALLDPVPAPPPPPPLADAPSPAPIGRLARARQALSDLRTTAPRTSLSRPIGPRRRIAVVDFSLDEVRTAAHGHDATVNDVLLAAVTSGLRHLLAGRGDRLDGPGLRASVPVGAPSADRRDGILVLDLPVGEPSVERQLVLLAARTRGLKARLASGGGNGMDVLRLPLPLARLLIRWMRRTAGRRVNLFVTNVPGPGVPLTLDGAPLLQAVPLAPLVRGVPIGVAALSYAGRLCVSIDADAAVDDVDQLAAGMRDGVAELRRTTPDLEGTWRRNVGRTSPLASAPGS